MDNVTAEMCKTGVEKVRYASVLVEVPASKCVPDEIEVVYRDTNKKEKTVNQFVFQKKKMEGQDDANKRNLSPNKTADNGKIKGGSTSSLGSNVVHRKALSVQGDILDALKRSSNKFDVLREHDTEEIRDVNEEISPADGDIEEVNDVYNDENEIAQGMENDVIKGIDKGVFGEGQKF
ncbi:hypothetical protein Tco_0996204 [Tanacetum coccineum]